jgi:hypothetical protein
MTLISFFRWWSDSFLPWDGWGFVQSLIGVVALSGLIFGLWRFMLERRLSPLVALTINPVFTETDHDGSLVETVELRNMGRGFASLEWVVFVNLRAHFDGANLMRWSIGPGESLRMRITSADLARSWILVLYSDHGDRRILHATWLPLADYESSSFDWDSSYRKFRQHRAWWRRSWELRHPPVVSPNDSMGAQWLGIGDDSAARMLRVVSAATAATDAQSIAPFRTLSGSDSSPKA